MFNNMFLKTTELGMFATARAENTFHTEEIFTIYHSVITDG